LKAQGDGRDMKIIVTSDGAGRTSHADRALPGQVADQGAVTRALAVGLAGVKEPRRGHDPGRAIRDLAVCLPTAVTRSAIPAAQRDQAEPVGAVASDPGVVIASSARVTACVASKAEPGPDPPQI
jgi:hypothetical protein